MRMTFSGGGEQYNANAVRVVAVNCLAPARYCYIITAGGDVDIHLTSDEVDLHGQRPSHLPSQNGMDCAMTVVTARLMGNTRRQGGNNEKNMMRMSDPPRSSTARQHHSYLMHDHLLRQPGYQPLPPSASTTSSTYHRPPPAPLRADISDSKETCHAVSKATVELCDAIYIPQIDLL
jgi:hypothetical protein